MIRSTAPSGQTVDMTGGKHGTVYPRPRVPAWATDVIAAAAIVLATVLPVPGEPAVIPNAHTFVLVLAGAAVLPLRRRWPMPILAASVVLFGIAAVSGLLGPGNALVVAIAMFGVTDRTDRRTGLFISAAVVALTIGLSLLGGLLTTMPDPRLLQYGLAVAFAAAMGDATRSRREYVAAAIERAERAEQTREAEAKRRVSEERLKIAQDLHDTVAHQIAVINLHAGVASSMVDGRPEKAKQSLATIRSAARTVLGEIGDLLEVLRADDEAGPSTAPQPGLDRLDDLVARFEGDGLDVTVRVEGDLHRVTAAVDLVAYRLVQESLTNAHKHGADHRAHVLITVADHTLDIVVTNPVTIAVRDSTGSRLGLIGLRERVASVRGVVETGPCPGGWKVAARLPLSKEATL